MYKKTLLIILLLLCACTPAAPIAPTQELTPDDVATQVSLLLTTMPTATVPGVVVTQTALPEESPAAPEPATSIPEATAEPAGEVTATTAATATETLAPTLSPTPGSSPTPTEIPPDWRDALDTPDSFYLYDNGNTRISHENGHLILTGVNANGWMGWSLTYGQPQADLRLRAVFQPQTCTGSDIYGLVFRASSGNAGYFFGITCDGHYSLSARNFDDGTTNFLIEASEAAAIRQGSNTTNVLEVRASGDRIGLYVNDTLLQEVTDATYSAGYFGAFIAANETAGFSVWMDEIELWYMR